MSDSNSPETPTYNYKCGDNVSQYAKTALEDRDIVNTDKKHLMGKHYLRVFNRAKKPILTKWFQPPSPEYEGELVKVIDDRHRIWTAPWGAPGDRIIRGYDLYFLIFKKTVGVGEDKIEIFDMKSPTTEGAKNMNGDMLYSSSAYVNINPPPDIPTIPFLYRNNHLHKAADFVKFQFYTYCNYLYVVLDLSTVTDKDMHEIRDRAPFEFSVKINVDGVDGAKGVDYEMYSPYTHPVLRNYKRESGFLFKYKEFLIMSGIRNNTTYTVYTRHASANEYQTCTFHVDDNNKIQSTKERDDIIENTKRWATHPSSPRNHGGNKARKGSLDNCTVAELKAKAAKRGVKVIGLNKAEIIAKLRRR